MNECNFIEIAWHALYNKKSIPLVVKPMIKLLHANVVGCLSTNLVGLGILMRVIGIYFEEKTLTSNYVQKLRSYGL